MAFTSRNIRKENHRTLTLTTQEVITEQKKLKIAFEENERAQMNNYIKDLQKTIRINKEIITEMFNTNKQRGEADKMTLKKLNQENKELQTMLSRTIEKNNELQGELLIKQQIIANFSIKEQEIAIEYNEQIKELIDQLDQKEYVLQHLHDRKTRAENILQHYLAQDYRVKVYFREPNANTIELPKRITSVIQKNKELQQMLKEANEKIQAQEKEEAALRHLNEQLISTISELKICEKSFIEIDIKEPSQYNFLSPSEYYEKIGKVCAKFSSQLALINKENEKLHNKIHELEEKNKLLMKLDQFIDKPKDNNKKHFRMLSRSFDSENLDKNYLKVIGQKKLLNSKLDLILENSIDFMQSFSVNPEVLEKQKDEAGNMQEVAIGNVMEEETSFGDLSGIIELPRPSKEKKESD